MKKLFLTLAISLVVLFALSVSVFATEYTVNSNEEYITAYEQATNGDIITINSKLTCDIQAMKDITYILKADWESSNFVLQSNVSVSFVADGENCRIMPTNYSTVNGWFNITSALENVTINLMGINDGTITLDGSNATHDRVSYVSVSSDITWNFFNGSAIANFNTTTQDTNNFACILYSKTFNMYEGSEIYANKISAAPLIKSTDFNMYGGKIFGNLLTSTKTASYSCGAIFVSNQFVAYDGKFCDNIFDVKSGPQINHVGFFSLREEKPAIVLGLEVGVNYTSGTANGNISALFGTSNKDKNAYGYYTSNYIMGTRKVFTAGTVEQAYNNDIGKTVWQITNPIYGTTNNSWTGYSWVHSKGLCDNTVAFISINEIKISDNVFYEYNLEDLFVIGVTAINGFNVTSQKNYTYSYTGTSTLTIPSKTSVWSTEINEYCHNGKTMTVDEIKTLTPAMLFASYENSISDENGTTACTVCGKTFTCENNEHEKEVSIIYNDFTDVGIKRIKCKVCEVVNTIEAPAMFTCRGYSAPEDGRGGIAIGFTVNNVAIAEYEEATGKTLKYGVFAVLQSKLKDKDVFAADGTVAEGVISAEITNYQFVAFELKIVGFTDEQKDTKLAMGAFVEVVTTDGVMTSSEYSYMQGGVPADGDNYYFVSYNDIVNLTIETTSNKGVTE